MFKLLPPLLNSNVTESKVRCYFLDPFQLARLVSSIVLSSFQGYTQQQLYSRVFFMEAKGYA